MQFVPVLVILIACVMVFVGFSIRRHIFAWAGRVYARRRLRQADWDNKWDDLWEDQVVEGDWRGEKGDRRCHLCGREIPPGEWGFADGPLCHPNDPQLPDCYRLWTVHGHRPARRTEAAPPTTGTGRVRRTKAVGGDW